MARRTTYPASMSAAIAAFVCVILMGFVFRSADPDLSLQPSYPVGAAADFVRAVNEHADEMLRLFAADSLFVLSYLIVFAGMYATVVHRSHALAVLGMGAGALTALLDAAENAYFISYAQAALSGDALREPALTAIYVIANLKWMAAFAALGAFGLAWPRSDRLDRVLSALMLLFVLVGVLGVALPGLFAVRGLLFLIGMPLFAWHFRRQMHTV